MVVPPFCFAQTTGTTQVWCGGWWWLCAQLTRPCCLAQLLSCTVAPTIAGTSSPVCSMHMVAMVGMHASRAMCCGTDDALQLFLRSSRPQASQGLLIGLGKWNRQSNILRVADYIEGGVIDTEWRRVFIPLNDLRTAEWSLGGSSTIHFHNTSAHCNFAFPASTHACDSFFVDDISVLDMTPPFIKSWVALSGDLFELEVNEPYDPVAVENPALFGLVSDTDPTYVPSGNVVQCARSTSPSPWCACHASGT